MSYSNRKSQLPKRFPVCFAAAAFAVLLLATSAAAADAGWRPVYDKIMVWVNFFIFVFLVVRYGRKPLMNFLQGQKDEVADNINQLQKQKNSLETKISKTRQMINDSISRYEQIKQRIMEDGERIRQKIIEDAMAQGKNIIEQEKLKATHQISQAKSMFMSELTDEASELALKRLPAEINDADHSKLLDMFVSNLSEIAAKQSA